MGQQLWTLFPFICPSFPACGPRACHSTRFARDSFPALYTQLDGGAEPTQQRCLPTYSSDKLRPLTNTTSHQTLARTAAYPCLMRDSTCRAVVRRDSIAPFAQSSPPSDGCDALKINGFASRLPIPVSTRTPCPQADCRRKTELSQHQHTTARPPRGPETGEAPIQLVRVCRMKLRRFMYLCYTTSRPCVCVCGSLHPSATVGKGKRTSPGQCAMYAAPTPCGFSL